MARHNLCTNPSATNDVTGWTGGATPVRQTGLTGFSRTTGARYSSGTFMQVAAGAASPGLDYTVSVDIRPNTNGIGSGTFYVAFTRSTGGDDFSHTVALGSIAANTVVRKAFTATAPANTTGVYLIIDGVNFGAVGSVDFTAVLYEQASSAGTFFDGDTPGASWDGTAGNSASTLADAGANPTGLAVALALGTPAVALGLTAAPAGLASAIATGTPAVAIPSAAPTGLGITVTLGTPTVAINRTAAPTGIPVGAAPGAPAAGAAAATPADVGPRIVTSSRPRRITTSGSARRIDTSSGGPR